MPAIILKLTAGRNENRYRATARLLTAIFGCRHRNLSRPFTHEDETYRTCVDCGARRQFDLGNWQMSGRFFFAAPKRASMLEGQSRRRISTAARVRNEHSLRLTA